jgi:hypothetical protein
MPSEKEGISFEKNNMTLDGSDTKFDDDSESDGSVMKDFVVTPWKVEGDVDYSKLIETVLSLSASRASLRVAGSLGTSAS